jgi:hypothetical protein
VHEPDALETLERPEQRPVAGADRDARRPRLVGERGGDPTRQAAVAPLEIEHQLGGGTGGAEQRAELQPRLPAGSEPPAVPQQRQRTQRLEVADLDPAAPQVQISLDETRSECLGVPQHAQVVAGTVRHDERCGHALQL